MSNPRHPAQLVASVGMAVALCTGVGAAPAPQVDRVEVDRLFAPWTGGDSPGCAVSAMRDGTIVFAKGYGRAHLEYDIPLTPSSVFHVASVAKQFTALAVQLLVNDGLVAWDDDIRDHVPELIKLDQPITLSQLAHHTSGIRDQWSLLRMAGWRPEADVVTTADALDLLTRQERLNFAPGSGYLYSNSGYTLLALVVERNTGQSLRAFTTERIFEPLGMTTTHFHDDHHMVVPNRAYAYALDGAGGFRSSLPDFDIVGATGLFTTVEDLARWDRNFYTFEVGGESGLRQLLERGELTEGRSITYARGLAHGTHRGFATVGHGGTDAGYRSEFVRFPDQGLAVAVLCNLRSTNPSQLARRVADVFLPRPAGGRGPDTSPEVASSRALREKPPLPRPNSEPDLSRYAGYYRLEATDVPMRLVERQGSLVTIGTGPSLRFRRTDENRFHVLGDRSTSARFVGSEGAAPTGMRLGDVDPDEYERSDPWYPGAADLAAFEGVYRSDELAVDYTFTVRAGRLELWNRKLGAITLMPTYPDGFYGQGLYLAFGRDRSGAVDRFTVSTPRAWKVGFTKIQDAR